MIAASFFAKFLLEADSFLNRTSSLVSGNLAFAWLLVVDVLAAVAEEGTRVVGVAAAEGGALVGACGGGVGTAVTESQVAGSSGGEGGSVPREDWSSGGLAVLELFG